MFWSFIALVYYSLLACFKYTWVFSGGDAGDWLASAKVWFIPQPYGSPLFISITKLIGLLPGSLTTNMTYLSIIPAALGVGFVYQAAKNLTGKTSLARMAAIVCLGAGVLTSQAVIVEEYGLTFFFLSAAILAYSAKHKYWTIALLGLTAAVHSVAFPIAFLFYLAHVKEWRYWIKTIPLFLLCGVAPYLLILAMFILPTPRWVYYGNFFQWQGSTGNLGTLAAASAPLRILQVIGLVVGSVGMAIIPAARMLKERRQPLVAWLSLSTIFIAWLFLTSRDIMVWPYLFYVVPFIAILAVMGLQNAKRFEVATIMAVSAVLFIANINLLDVRRLDAANPVGTTLYNEAMALPDGSYILLKHGGFYSLGIFYVKSQGKEVNLRFLADGLPDTNARIFLVNSAYVEDWDAKYIIKPYSADFNEILGAR